MTIEELRALIADIDRRFDANAALITLAEWNAVRRLLTRQIEVLEIGKAIDMALKNKD